MPALRDERLDLHRRFRAVVYLLAFTTIAGIAYAEGNSTLILLGGIGCAASWWLGHVAAGRPLPRVLVNIGVLSASVFLLLEWSLGWQDNLLLALAHFMVAVLVCKLFEGREGRDFAQAMILMLLIMVAGSIFSQSLIFGAILAVYLALALYALLLFHLLADLQAATADGSAPAEPGRAQSGPLALAYQTRQSAFRLALALFVFAAALFVLFPRQRSGDMVGSWNIARQTLRTGLSDRVRFSDFGRIQLSDALVMEVRLEQDGVNIGSENLQPYFRAMVFDRYDRNARQWVAFALEDRAFLRDARARQLVPPDQYSPTNLLYQRYSLHASAGTRLFTASLAERPLPVVNFPANDALREVSYNSENFTLLSRALVPTPVDYEVVSATGYNPTRLPKAFVRVPGQLRGATGGTVNVSSEIMTLARQIGGNLVDRCRTGEASPQEVRALAERLASYLRTTYPYSLEYRQVDPRLDPTTDFLVNRKSAGGHCEFFASSMVMLCTAAGLNARMVGGYHGGDYNSLGGFYTVRQRYAHAWAEVVVPTQGWVTYDATPAAGTAPPTWASSWIRSLRELSEIVQKNWLSRIIAFDSSTRRYFFETLGTSTRSWAQSGRTGLASVLGFAQYTFSADGSWRTRLGIIGLAGGSLTGAVWLLIYLRRRSTSKVLTIVRQMDPERRKQMQTELRFFDDLLSILSRTGTTKGADQTPQEYVDSVAPALGQALAQARWLVGLFYAIRFGYTALTPALQARVTEALAQLRTAVRGDLHAASFSLPTR